MGRGHPGMPGPPGIPGNNTLVLSSHPSVSAWGMNDSQTAEFSAWKAGTQPSWRAWVSLGGSGWELAVGTLGWGSVCFHDIRGLVFLA